MVAEKISNYMRERGIKGTVIAQKAGITQQQMSAILSNRIQLKADVFFRICEALEVSPEIFAPENTKEISA